MPGPTSHPRINGNQVDGLIRQTGDTLKQQDDGSWEGVVKYICRWAKVLQLAPKRNVAQHPDFSVLICTTCEVDRLNPGIMCELTATYRGFFDADVADNSTEELVTNTSEAPIDAHPAFNSDIGGTKAAPLNGAVFDEDGKFTGWKSDSKYAGVESFVTPSTVYRFCFSTKSRPATLAGVGTKSTSGGYGSPPGAGDREWLFISSTWRREGGLYLVTNEHMLSGPRGWDDVIYS
jgi:hypothetical protein